MSMLVCVPWFIALLALMACICLVPVIGLGTLMGLVEKQFLTAFIWFTLKFWLWWLGATFVGFGISYYNTCRHEAACRG